MSDKIKVDDRKEVELKIAIPEGVSEETWKLRLQYYNEDLEKLPKIKEGDINVAGIYCYKSGDKYEAFMYIRNGLNREINFDKLPLLIVNSKAEVLASQVFELKELGNIPPLSALPVKLYFDKENVKGEIGDDWKIIFGSEIQALNTKKFELEGVPESLDPSEVRQLEDFVQSLPHLKAGEITVNPYKVLNDESGIYVFVLLRNGAEKGIKIEKMPIKVEDANKALVASGIFDLSSEEANVKPSTARLFSFKFSKENLLTEEIDLSSWNIRFE